MSNLPTAKMRRKLYFVVIVAIVTAFCIISSNIVRITIFEYDEYRDRATGQQLSPKNIPATRGTIYDRNMSVIAQSATVWDVILAPKNMEETQVDYIAKSLGDILGDTPENKKSYTDKILTNSTTDSAYVILKKKVEKPVADSIRKLIVTGFTPEGEKKASPLKGIDLTESSKRYYPNSTFASSLVGFTGSDSQGLYGVELSYDKELSGTPGYIVSAQNALGEAMPVSFEEKFDPIHGNNIVLTLDESIQHFLDNALTERFAKHKPTMGIAGIVMNVNTGEILAMSNLPTFNLNDPWSLPDATVAEIALLPEAEQKDARSLALQAQWSNKNISYTYQPGSTFKTVVASAALEEKTSSLDSTFSCPGYVIVGDRKMGCHIGLPGHGTVDFTGALVGSCNPAFVKIGSNLGASAFYKYYKGFGLTQKTGIDLPGENIGSYYTDQNMSEVSLASSSFGQSQSVTPIQLITSVCAVVNGGKLVTPHVVKDILDQNGNIIKTIEPQIKRQVISEETSATLRSMMEQVVDVKTGTNAGIMGYRIGGKSGTSQKLNPGDSTEARIGSYVGVAPADKPEIAVFIMIDEPTTGQVFGSVIAAPGVAAVLQDTLPYLGYSPQYTPEQEAKREIVTPYLLKMGVLEAQSKLAQVGLSKPRIIGEGVNVVKQIPDVSEKIPRDGTVILYTDVVEETQVAMPNVVGLSPAAAKAMLDKAKLNVIINGLATEHKNSTITEQSVAEGVMTPIGTVIEITCLKSDTD